MRLVRRLSVTMVLIMICSLSFTIVPQSSVSVIKAVASPKLSKKTLVVNIGKSNSIKFVTNGWSIKSVSSKISNKNLAKISVSKKRITIKGMKAGRCKVSIAIKAKKSQKVKSFKFKASVIVKQTQLSIKQFSLMLSEVIKKSDSSLLSSWNNVAKLALNDLKKAERDDAMLILYEAACVLGMGKRSSAFWLDYNAAYDTEEPDLEYSPREDLFSNCHKTAPFESLSNHNAGWDYITASGFYSLGYSSSKNPISFFNNPIISGGYNIVISGEEGKKAAERLYDAYICEHEGSFDINDYSTNWNDTNLKTAAVVKDSIVNSSTNIVKSDSFVQGESYTGNAYYVSNTGNDSNDGLSPESAWKTMEKVSSASLQYGDVVFFERGGAWNGILDMQKGVTYSAYGTGSKPIWTGSPFDILNSSKWELYGESINGGKIWKYVEKTADVGCVLLNNHIVARKYYPVWDGNKYVSPDGRETMDIKKHLSTNLMFCTELDLTDIRCLW